MRLVKLFAFGLALPLSLAACGDSTSGDTGKSIDTDTVQGDTGGDTDPGPTAAGLDTEVTATQVTAGESLTVGCKVVDADGAAVPASLVSGLTGFEARVSPADGVTVDGLTVTPTVAGTLEIACQGVGADIADETPVTVTVVPAAPARTTAAVAPPDITAGEDVTATCAVEDAFGNAIEGLAATFTLTDTADGGASGPLPATPTQAGTFAVTCAVETTGTLEATPATLTVAPGEAVSLTLSTTPAQKSYWLGQAITLVGAGVDAFGNTFPMAVGAPTVTPGDHHEILTNGRIRFSLEGHYVVSAAAEDDPSLTASLPLVVDQTPPVVTLLTPERGLATTQAQVLVTGTVTDNLGEVASLTIAGTPVPVGEDGAFSFEAPLAYGVNVLEVVAADPWDLTRTATRSVLASGTFNPVTEEGFDKAVVLVLHADAIDDGVQDLSNPDDLASLVALLLQQIDFAAFLPDPLVGFGCLGGDCEIRLSQVTYDTPTVSMKPISNALRLEIALPNLAGTLQLEVPCGNVLCPSDPLVLPGTFGAQTVVLKTEVKVTLAADGTPELVAENTDVDVQGITVTIANSLANVPVVGPAIQGVIDNVVGWMEPGLVSALELAVPLVVEDQVGSALSGVLEALDLAQDIEIPAVVEGGAPNTLRLATRLAAIDINTQFMRLELTAGARSVSPPPEDFDPVHVETGSLGYLGCGPKGAVSAPPPDRIAAGLQDDLINQLLLAVYAGGTLALDMDAEAAASFDLAKYGIELYALSTLPALPPVLNSCGREGAGVLQLGDFWLEVELNLLGTPSHIALWVHLEAPVDLEATTNEDGDTELSLLLGDIALGADVITNTGTFEGDDEGLVSLLGDVLLPLALDSLTDGGLAFTLPAIDLSSLDESVPEGTVIRIGVNDIVRNQGYLQVQGALK